MVRWRRMLSLFMVSPWQVIRGHPFNCHDRRAGSTWFCKSPRYKRSVADHKIPLGTCVLLCLDSTCGPCIISTKAHLCFCAKSHHL